MMGRAQGVRPHIVCTVNRQGVLFGSLTCGNHCSIQGLHGQGPKRSLCDSAEIATTVQGDQGTVANKARRRRC